MFYLTVYADYGYIALKKTLHKYFVPCLVQLLDESIQLTKRNKFKLTYPYWETCKPLNVTLPLTVMNAGKLLWNMPYSLWNTAPSRLLIGCILEGMG